MPNNIVLGIGAGIAAMIALVIIWLSLTNAHLKAQLAVAQANGVACHIINADFKATLDKQNAAIKAIQDEGAARAAHAEAAVKAAKLLADRYAAKAARLMKQKPNGDDCKAAKEIMDAYR